MNKERALRRLAAYRRHLDWLYEKAGGHPYPDDLPEIAAWRSTYGPEVIECLEAALARLEEPSPVRPEEKRIEVTIGVCVPMTFDGEKYVVSAKPYLTTGGLFEDAEVGVWCEEADLWISNYFTNKAMGEAAHLVASLVARA